MRLEQSMRTTIQRIQTLDPIVRRSRYMRNFYRDGWFIKPGASVEFFHSGGNPTFTSFVTFNPDDKIGLAVMANSFFYGNIGANYLGGRLMAMMSVESTTTPIPSGQEPQEYEYSNPLDNVFSIGSYIFGGLSILSVLILLYMLFDTIRGRGAVS